VGPNHRDTGVTTSVIGALKRVLLPRSAELGVYTCGGRGRHSRKTPEELVSVGERTGLDADQLIRASRLSARRGLPIRVRWRSRSASSSHPATKIAPKCRWNAAPVQRRVSAVFTTTSDVFVYVKIAGGFNSRRLYFSIADRRRNATTTLARARHCQLGGFACRQPPRKRLGGLLKSGSRWQPEQVFCRQPSPGAVA
jgi:hypothetical protein